VVENVQIHMSRLVLFFGLKFCTNVESNYERGILDLFLRKKSLDLQKIEKHGGTFSHWFWFGNKFLHV